MASTGSQFKIREYAGFGGDFVDSDYLGQSFDANKPHVFDNVLAKVFTSSDRFTGKPLLGMTQAKDKVKYIDNEIYRWYLQGAEHKALRVLENLESGNNTPGIGRTPIKVKLDEDWCKEPDVMLPESEEYPLQIVGEPEPDGNGFIYTLQLETDDMSLFLPPEYLEEGREFTKGWTTIQSEYNDQFGTQQYSSVFQLESQISYFAQHKEITDKAMRQSNRLGIPFYHTDPKTGKKKKVEKFMPLCEAKMKDELYMSMEAQMLYGKKHTSSGKDGYWKKTGPGLREQLKDGHTEYFNGPLTEERLRDYLMDIFFSRVEEQDRKIVAMTGTGGAIMFHNLLASSASSFLTEDTHFIQKAQDGDPRHLSYGAQFTHYYGPEGIEVTLMKNPMYDSTRYSKRMHPVEKDKPLDSWRFTFLDFGTSDGEDNIQMLKERNFFRHTYRPGTIGPNGPVQGGMSVMSKAGMEYTIEGSAGIWMKDVTRGGELIYDVE